jgi:HlyD family secretion protein
MRRLKFFAPLLLILMVVPLAGCQTVAKEDGPLTASGTISADDLRVSPEIGGKVIEVLVEEGDTVQAGDVLFRVDDEILQAQYDQAAAAVETARSTVETAEAQLDSVRLQYEMVLQGARLQDMQNRSMTWLTPSAQEIELPAWYFGKAEKIDALRAEVDEAQRNLEAQTANLDKELDDVSNEDFVEAEKRLAEAQAAFEIASLTLTQARAAVDNQSLIAAAQDGYDVALADLEAAQLEYDRMLTTSAAEDVLEARANVAVARVRLDNAQDQLDLMLSGEESYEVDVAHAGVALAEKTVTQSRANLAQAEAALKAIEIQLDKTDVRAADDGVILSSSVKKGELVSAGVTVMTIGKLSEVRLTVYIPEDQYGQLQVGQDVSITSDSFPGGIYLGTVQRIADEAEYTPSDVQTMESRKATVYAVEISVPNEDLDLKPGMPVDVEFLSS